MSVDTEQVQHRGSISSLACFKVRDSSILGGAGLYLVSIDILIFGQVHEQRACLFCIKN